MYLIDSNFFIEIFLGRNKYEECVQLLNKTRQNSITLVITTFAVHSIEMIINKQKGVESSIEFLNQLLKSENIEVYNTLLAEEIKVLESMKKNKLDFDDALQLYVAKQLECRAIISFDKDFDSLEIPRMEPSEVLEKMN